MRKPSSAAEPTLLGSPGPEVPAVAGADRAVSDWLAASLDNPAKAHREWDSGVALLRTGLTFDAIRIPAPVIHAAAASEDPDTVSAFLADNLNQGAVIHDAYTVGVSYYALVPAGTHANWRTSGTPCLPPGTWLGVPHPSRTARPGPYWALPPHSPGDLCTPLALVTLIAVGHIQLHQLSMPS
ncbi:MULTISPECIES: hypothetical protein [unclassified Streptomyces]|uniref:Uncharacterized protein n=1 Tax=Streptomyces sp. NBC_00060 TaxID=2975636 RepID=A0AAU2HD46_9ACTN